MITEKSTIPMNGASKAVEERRALARQIFRDYPDKIPRAIQEKILSQQIVLGMTPYDAYLAGGAFAFRVISDAKKWPSNADPYEVMWAQSISPDESQIWMTFENETQYLGKGKVRFRVFFTGGKASSVEVLDREEHI